MNANCFASGQCRSFDGKKHQDTGCWQKCRRQKQITEKTTAEGAANNQVARSTTEAFKMTNLKFNNGPEDADKSSDQNETYTLQQLFMDTQRGFADKFLMQHQTSIQTPANGSRNRTYYRETIAEYFGCRKMTRGVTEVRDGIEYTFTFRHDECGRTFKVFKSDDLSEFDKYAQYPGKLIIIVNVEDHPDCKLDEEVSRDFTRLLLPAAFSEKLRKAKKVYVYYEGELCEESYLWGDDSSDWDSLIPGPICGYEWDEDED